MGRPRRAAYNGLGRRDLLGGIGALGGLALLPGCHAGRDEVDDGVCNLRESAPKSLANGDWLRGARVAGLAAFADATLCDFAPELDRMADERVTVVEIDGDLSSYLDDRAFGEQLSLLDRIGRECHARGMRSVAYWPVLEVLTADAAATPHTMAKDHPDWLQIGIDGAANVFVGGSGRAFWIEDGEESAWLCPTSGYVDELLVRLANLARTSIDGLWGDVPLLNDIVGVWPCVNASCRARFLADTGLELPSAVDWEDPRFVRWVTWRHHVIWALEQRIVASAKRVRSDFEVIIETVTIDYTAATMQGLDGAYADDGAVHRVWEVDAISDATSMRGATEGDWYSMAVMMKFARAATGPRPSWVFCYGKEEDDAERVMALAVATGSSPYETQIPQMNTSVGSAFRKRMYGWLERHPQILLSTSASSVAVLHSSVSRDVLDRARAVGLYTSMNGADPLWWTNEDTDAAQETEYIADFRGLCSVLLQRHVPFDVVTTPHAGAQALSRYATLLVPSAAALAPELVVRLRAYAEAGGTLLVTGDDAGSYDQLGGKLPEPALLRALGIGPKGAAVEPEWVSTSLGRGRVLHARERMGQRFLRSDDDGVADRIAALVDTPIETNAPPQVLFELRTADTGELVVACASVAGLGRQGVGVWTPGDVTLSCAVEVGDRRVASVTVTKPDAGAQDAIVPFTMDGTRVRFALDLRAIAVALVTLE